MSQRTATATCPLDDDTRTRLWARVNYAGGKPYLDDPLARLTATAGECWVWTGWTSDEGYGRMRLGSRTHSAHRLTWLDDGRSLTDADDLDHLCRNTRCVRPSHLEAVPHAENIARGRAGNKTHCPHGHAYTPENTRYQSRRGTQVRYCRTCLSASKHRTYLRSKLTA